MTLLLVTDFHPGLTKPPKKPGPCSSKIPHTSEVLNAGAQANSSVNAANTDKNDQNHVIGAILFVQLLSTTC